MLESLLHLAPVLLHGLALACLALAQERYWQASRGLPPRFLQGAGGGLLAFSLGVALLLQGAAFGSLIWLMLWPVNGLVVALGMARARRRAGTQRPAR